MAKTIEMKYELGSWVSIDDAKISGRLTAFWIVEGGEPQLLVEYTDNTGRSQSDWFLESRVKAVL